MKNITIKLAIVGALLFACLAPATSSAGDKPKHNNGKSGIVGHVVELVGPWHIRIVTETGEFVEDIQADQFGAFKVDLRPGTYRLTPFFPSLDGGGALIGATQTVIVEKKQFTTVELLIVNGPF